MKDQVLVIIGSGPAAFTAAIYSARANLKPLLFEGFYSGPSGGQLVTTTEVENFPGFPEGISGPELMDRMKKQALRFGTHILTEDVKECDFSKRPFMIQGSKTRVNTKTVIVATGASAKRLNVLGTREGEFWQRGVTACAVCDGAMPIFRNKELYVIGGGDTAVEEAVFLTKYASKVYIVHRRNELRASKIMAERAVKHPKIEIIWDNVLVSVHGENVITSIKLKNVKTNVIEERKAGGVFFAIGHNPNTSFLNNQLDLASNGYILVKPGSTQTSVEGVFAAGDVFDGYYRQAITAAGSGCMAAMEAERWLVHQGHS